MGWPSLWGHKSFHLKQPKDFVTVWLVLVFWLDRNAVKDVVGSRPLAAGGENQNKQDPSHLRSCSITMDKTTTRAPKPGKRNRERQGLWLPLGTKVGNNIFLRQDSPALTLSLTHTHAIGLSWALLWLQQQLKLSHHSQLRSSPAVIHMGGQRLRKAELV